MTLRVNIKLPKKVQAARRVNPSALACATAPADSATQEAVSVALQSKLQEMQLAMERERSKVEFARQALADGLEKLSRLQVEMMADAEQQLLDLAVDIARKVLMQEIQAQRYQIDPIVKEALLHVPARQDVLVHLNPDDYATCELARGSEDPSLAGKIRFVADPAVEPAECLLETIEGLVISSVEDHLESIADALKNPEEPA